MIEWDDDIEYDDVDETDLPAPSECPECEGFGCSFGFDPAVCPALVGYNYSLEGGGDG